MDIHFIETVAFEKILPVLGVYPRFGKIENITYCFHDEWRPRGQTNLGYRKPKLPTMNSVSSRYH